MSNFKIRPPAIPFRHAWTRLESESFLQSSKHLINKPNQFAHKETSCFASVMQD